jgi:hypothetical protein
MTTVACVVVATEKRKALVNGHIVPSIRDQGFDEVIITANYRDRNVNLYIPDTHRNTLDALERKQKALEATVSDVLVYVVDDHYLDDCFLEGLRGRLREDWDILCPWRFTRRDHHLISLNMGKDGAPDGGRDYVAGHAGIYRRSLLEKVGWQDILDEALRRGPSDASTLLYDTWGTHIMVDAGARLCYCEYGSPIAVVDIEHYLSPEVQPWR